MRDKIINLHSSVANGKDILKKALINNTSNPDQNILQGEIAVINTAGNEGIYTLNSDGTDIIEFKPLSKEEKEQITALISSGVKDEIYIGTEAPTGDEVVWIDTDENPTYSDIAVTEAPKDGKTYGRKDGTWSVIEAGSSTHTLDLSPLFDGEGTPVATVSEDFLVELQKAYDEKYSNCILFGGNAPMLLQIADGDFVIDIMLLMQESKKVTLAAYHIVINNSDKSVSFIPIGAVFDQSGQGTKALTDNGQYAEFAKPVTLVSGSSGAVTQEIQPNKYYQFGECSSLTITLASGTTGYLNEYMFEFSCSPSIATTFNNIPGVVWQNGEPLVPEAGYKYQVSIVNNMGVYGKFPLPSLTYKTTGASESVQLIYKQEYANKITLEDGTDVPITGTGKLNYTFPEAGDHKVYIEFKEDVTDFSNCLSNCIRLTSIPDNLFANNTAVTNFSECFSGCTSLTSIPDNLFANNTAVTTFSYCFQHCFDLTSIPENLFANNTKVTNFSSCFQGCSGLTGSIPANLFANNTAVTTFESCFYDCLGLTGSMPENLFANNTAVTNFGDCFYNCRELTGNVPIDNDGTPIYSRSGSGKPGYTIVTYYIDCFRNCYGLTDYDSIPEDWT